MAFEYAGDREHIEDYTEELEVEEKTASPPPAAIENERGTLLSAGVCLRVPFSRVTVTQHKKMADSDGKDIVDFAGVSGYVCMCIVYCSMWMCKTQW